MNLPQPTLPLGRQQGWHALNYHQNGSMNAAPQFEQEAHHRTEVAVAEAAAQTQADMLHEFFRIEQVAENTVAN